VRLPIIAGAALAGLLAGCMDTTLFLVPAQDVFKLETWKTVPEGQQEVRGRVGAVFHLPLGPATDIPALVWLRVSINDKPVECPEFHTSSKTTCYVFRGARAGHYRVEIHRDFVIRDDSTAKKTATPEPDKSDTAPARKNASSWPARTWDITISE
jgi:hypothetical protein